MKEPKVGLILFLLLLGMIALFVVLSPKSKEIPVQYLVGVPAETLKAAKIARIPRIFMDTGRAIPRVTTNADSEWQLALEDAKKSDDSIQTILRTTP